MWISASALQSHSAQLRLGRVYRPSQLCFGDTALSPGSTYRQWEEIGHLYQGVGLLLQSIRIKALQDSLGFSHGGWAYKHPSGWKMCCQGSSALLDPFGPFSTSLCYDYWSSTMFILSSSPAPSRLSLGKPEVWSLQRHCLWCVNTFLITLLTWLFGWWLRWSCSPNNGQYLEVLVIICGGRGVTGISW